MKQPSTTRYSFRQIQKIGIGLIVIVLCSFYANVYAQKSETEQPAEETENAAQNKKLSGSIDTNTKTLLIESSRRSRKMHKTMTAEYSFSQKTVSRWVNDKGRVKKETVKTFEVYPALYHLSVLVQTSENGVPSSPERIAKERLKASKRLEKFDAENQKKAATQTGNQTGATAEKGVWYSLRISSESAHSGKGFWLNPQIFLRANSFENARRENFRGRETLIVEFRPQDSFVPTTEEDKTAAKLSGAMWIDLSEKVIVRVEARPANIAKNGKRENDNTTSTITDAPIFVFEQTRFAENLWFPSVLSFDSSRNKSLFDGLNVTLSIEFTGYKRFSTEVKDVTIMPISQP